MSRYTIVKEIFMIITFCGHSDFCLAAKYESLLMSYLKSNYRDNKIEFYLGGYGAFDSFAYSCAKSFKTFSPNTILTLVVPYLKYNFPTKNYDYIVYPELENIPPKYAISYRNRFMVDKSDLIIAYVHRNYGGAYSMLKYAKSKGKRILNLTDL